MYDNNNHIPTLLFQLKNKYGWNKDDKTRMIDIKCNKEKYCTIRNTLPFQLKKLMKQHCLC